MRASHFTFAIPYHPGRINRSGKPCSSGNVLPFIASASSLPARVRLARRCCGHAATGIRRHRPATSSPAPIHPEEDDLPRLGFDAALLEQSGQAHAGPGRIAYQAVHKPGVAGISGALDGHAGVAASFRCSRSSSEYSASRSTAPPIRGATTWDWEVRVRSGGRRRTRRKESSRMSVGAGRSTLHADGWLGHRAELRGVVGEGNDLLTGLDGQQRTGARGRTPADKLPPAPWTSWQVLRYHERPVTR